MSLQYKSFENDVGKGEIACNKKFLLFPQCFLPILKNFLSYLSNLKLLSANCFSLEGSEVYCLDKSEILSICKMLILSYTTNF